MDLVIENAILRYKKINGLKEEISPEEHNRFMYLDFENLSYAYNYFAGNDSLTNVELLNTDNNTILVNSVEKGRINLNLIEIFTATRNERMLRQIQN